MNSGLLPDARDGQLSDQIFEALLKIISRMISTDFDSNFFNSFQSSD